MGEDVRPFSLFPGQQCIREGLRNAVEQRVKNTR